MGCLFGTYALEFFGMKHIFFDFDGVISPLPPKLMPTTPLKSPDGFDISYRDNVVAWMERLSHDDQVALYWLTTWTEKIHHLDPIGFPDGMTNITVENHVTQADTPLAP